jgi:hypothetical protein
MEKINEFLRPRIPNDLLGEYGSITLEKINHPPITLDITDNCEVCHLSAPVASIPETNALPLLWSALELNSLSYGNNECWIAKNHEDETLSVCRNLVIPELNADNFNQALDDLFDIASGIRSALLLDIDNESIQ